jgi:hypothetical protein
MLKGIVKFHSRIVEAELTFPLVEFDSKEPGVGKVEIEAANGNEILTAVHVTGVDSTVDGVAIARKVHMAALDRISFRESIVVENGDVTEQKFSQIDPPTTGELHFIHLSAEAGHLALVGYPATLRVARTAAHVKAELEQEAPAGERYYSFFRSARQSKSSVEEFMHLYNILLMLFDDSQARVDDFIMRENPGVPLTPDPRPNRTNNETVYTRLRNQFAHKRDADLDQTKAEMTSCLSGLIALTKRAIELGSLS